jgi:hypothetical protein
MKEIASKLEAFLMEKNQGGRRKLHTIEKSRFKIEKQTNPIFFGESTKFPGPGVYSSSP